MHFPSHVLSELDRNLLGQLRFSFQGLGVEELRRLRIGDPVEFRIQLDNTSGLPLAGLRGTVRPGARTDFAAVTFALATLGPNEKVTIATIRGVFRGPVDPALVDSGLASIAVSTRVDLSKIVFEEWDRAVKLAPQLSDTRSMSPGPPRRSPFQGAVPLSDA